MRVLDLFSAAAGGWSLGMHRAGFETVAACEVLAWRRALYSENNPKVRMYDDVRTVTAERLIRDLGYFPPYVVGSPPCQDISSANTKGQGVDGARSGLFFEAVRIIGEGRPRGFALENSANLRTRGADRVLEALEKLGYACWAFVVGVDDVGGNSERKRSWIIGFDIDQITDPHRQLSDGWPIQSGVESQGRGLSGDGPAPGDQRGPTGAGSLSGGHGQDGNGPASASEGAGDAPHADQAGQADGRLVPGLRQAEIAVDGRGAGRRADGPLPGEMGLRPSDRLAALQHRPDWSLDDLARHIRLDDGLPAWVAGTRVAVGGPRGTSAASLIVEAFGDSVCPQIPEAIGRAILRTEAALAAIYGRRAA